MVCKDPKKIFSLERDNGNNLVSSDVGTWGPEFTFYVPEISVTVGTVGSQTGYVKGPGPDLNRRINSEVKTLLINIKREDCQYTIYHRNHYFPQIENIYGQRPWTFPLQRLAIDSSKATGVVGVRPSCEVEGRVPSSKSVPKEVSRRCAREDNREVPLRVYTVRRFRRQSP